MWKFYLNGVSYPVRNLVLENEMNEYDFFSGVLRAPSDSVRAIIGKGGHIYPNHWVKITDYGGEVIFEGFLENVEENGLDLVLEGRDFKVLLVDESLPRNTEFINVTGSVAINSIVSYSSKLLHTVVGSDDVVIDGTLHFDNATLLKGIASVCNLHQLDFWVENSAGNFQLHFGSRGTVTSDVYYTGREINLTNSKTSARDIVNRQMVFGAGDGDLQIRCCVPWKDINDPDTDRCAGFDGYNAKCLHPTATVNQTVYGIMEGKPYTDKSITSLDVAISTAKQILDGSLTDEIEVSFAKYVNGLMLGDTIEVVDKKKNVNVVARIKYIRRNLDKKSLYLTFYGKDDTIESALAKVVRDSDLNDIQGVGATNLITLQIAENCGSGSNEELNVRFRFPDEVKFINRVYFSINMREFRAYSKSASAGGVHAHSLSLWHPDDDYVVYPLGVSSWPVGNVIIGAPGSPSAATSEESTTHEHDIVYGIYKLPLTDPSITIMAGVNGSEVTVGTYTSDQIDLDLTGFFSPIPGWQNIKITPNKNMQVEAFLHAQVYIQSN